MSYLEQFNSSERYPSTNTELLKLVESTLGPGYRRGLQMIITLEQLKQVDPQVAPEIKDLDQAIHGLFVTREGLQAPDISSHLWMPSVAASLALGSEIQELVEQENRPGLVEIASAARVLTGHSYTTSIDNFVAKSYAGNVMDLDDVLSKPNPLVWLGDGDGSHGGALHASGESICGGCAGKWVDKIEHYSGQVERAKELVATYFPDKFSHVFTK